MSMGSKRFLFVLAVLVAAATPASAYWVSLGGDAAVDVSVLESSPQRIALEVRVGGFERTDVTIHGGAYARITLPGEAVILEKGAPELPSVARSVIIPDDRRMELRVAEAEFTDLPGVVPIPSKGNLLRTVDPASVPWEFGPSYSAGGWYPATPAYQREPYILRDVRGAAVVVNPFAYDASTGTLRVYTRLVVELLDGGPGGENVLVREKSTRRYTSDFEEIYRHHFLNWGLDKYAMVPEVGSMLIICYDDFAPQVQPLVDWKNQMGLPTEMVLKSQIGTTWNQIAAFIQDYYDQSSDPKLAFVLLIGDAAQMPYPTASGGASDATYSKLAGGDDYPEIFVGRLSAENPTHVQTQVQKVISYEKEPLLAGDTWYPRGVGIASNQGPGDDGEYDNQHIGNIRTLLLGYGYTYVDQIYDPNANQTMVANAVNDGRTVINYCGHGSQNAWSSSGFSSTNVNALVNDNMLPFIFSVACVNGAYTSGSCFAEAWLRAQHNGVPSGAVATYMSSINQQWNQPMEAQDEANLLLVADEVRTFGGYTYNGSCSMMDKYGSSGVTEFNCWHIFGDPSLRLRTKNPTGLTVTHEAEIAPDAVSFDVETGLEGSLAGLSFQGQYLGSAFADASGHVTIPVQGPLPEGQEITLTVTGYNRIPYIGAVAVQPALQPQLVYDPASFNLEMEIDQTLQQELTISNQGQVGSILNFQLLFSSNTPASFLTMDPMSGSLGAGESAIITLTFSSVGLRGGIYEGTLIIDGGGNLRAYLPVRLRVNDPSSVDPARGIPAALTLEPSRPNPFTASATLRFGLPAAETVRLAVYDAAGRAVRTLVSGEQPPGYHAVTWDGRDASGRSLPAGAYFARLEANGRALTHRLLRVR